MKKSKWNRKLGTSKREQGIKTPKKPPLLYTMTKQRQKEEPTLSEMMAVLEKRG